MILFTSQGSPPCWLELRFREVGEVARGVCCLPPKLDVWEPRVRASRLEESPCGFRILPKTPWSKLRTRGCTVMVGKLNQVYSLECSLPRRSQVRSPPPPNPSPIVPFSRDPGGGGVDDCHRLAKRLS